MSAFKIAPSRKMKVPRRNVSNDTSRMLPKSWFRIIFETVIRIFFRFGEEMRPVTLNKVVKGYELQATGFRFDMNLSYKVDSILKEYAEGKPALVSLPNVGNLRGLQPNDCLSFLEEERGSTCNLRAHKPGTITDFLQHAQQRSPNGADSVPSVDVQTNR